MRFHSRHLLLAALLLGADAGGASPAPPPLRPCALPDFPAGARCASYPVFENRAAGSGRTIGLRVVVVPATSGQPTQEAITYFAGGPGDDSTGAVAQMARMFAPARASRDLVVVDFRGTGGSAPLNCEELTNSTGVQAFLDDFLPADRVRACRARLEKEHDLALYTSADAVDDIAEVLAAYGYARVNLYGASYGTRAVQVFARRHPELVRTMLLEGVVGMGDRDPLDFARSAQQALDFRVAECGRDAACAAAFPDLAGDLARLFAELERAPVTVALADAAGGAARPLRLDRHGLAQTLRYMLYLPSTAVALPLQVHLAAQGNFQPLAETAQLFASFMTSTSNGFYLSVTCPEDTRFIRETEIAPAIAGTFLGDFRIRAQQAACAAWAPRATDPTTLEPLVSGIPTLLVSGEADPVTPAAAGAAVASRLSQSLHLVIPGSAHGSEGMSGADCLERLANDFVAAGKVDGLDGSCVATMRHSPFVVAPPAEEVTLAPAELAALAGRYRNTAAGLELMLEVAGGQLRLSFPGEAPLRLRPIGDDRFELVGLPPGYAAVALRDAGGRLLALSLEQPGAPAERFERKE